MPCIPDKTDNIQGYGVRGNFVTGQNSQKLVSYTGHVSYTRHFVQHTRLWCMKRRVYETTFWLLRIPEVWCVGTYCTLNIVYTVQQSNLFATLAEQNWYIKVFDDGNECSLNYLFKYDRLDQSSIIIKV